MLQKFLTRTDSRRDGENVYGTKQLNNGVSLTKNYENKKGNIKNVRKINKAVSQLHFFSLKREKRFQFIVIGTIRQQISGNDQFFLDVNEL